MQYDPDNAGLQHGLQQLRAERRHRVAAERAGRLLAEVARRSGTGDDQRRLHAQLQPRAARPVPGRLQRQPRRDDAGDAQHGARPASRWCCPASRGRSSTARRTGSARRTSRRRRRSRSRRRSRPANDCGSSIRTSSSVHRLVERQLPARAHRDTVVEVRYIGNRNMQRVDARRTGTTSTSTRTASSTSSSWRRQNLRANVAGRPRRHVRVHRAGHGHVAAADLPGALLGGAVLAGRRPRRGTRRRSSRTRRGSTSWISTSRVRTTRRTTSGPATAARGGRTPRRPASPSNFWVLNPLVDSANVTLGAAGSRVSLVPGRPAPPALARSRRQGQLHVRQALGLIAAGAALRSRATSARRAFRTRSSSSGTTRFRSAAASGSDRT